MHVEALGEAINHTYMYKNTVLNLSIIKDM